MFVGTSVMPVSSWPHGALFSGVPSEACCEKHAGSPWIVPPSAALSRMKCACARTGVNALNAAAASATPTGPTVSPLEAKNDRMVYLLR